MKNYIVIKNAVDDFNYALVTYDKTSVKAFTISQSSSEWVEWVNSGSLSIQDVRESLDYTLQAELPQHITDTSLESVKWLIGEESISEIKSAITGAQVELVDTISGHGRRYAVKSLNNIDHKDVSGQVLSSIPASNRQRAIEYKARAFRTENQFAQTALEFKKARALWDPDLGPSGGWRCPAGSQYGGYITDRFGRGCGGGIIRRVGRALVNAGRGIDRVGERLDKRRLDRAAARAQKPGIGERLGDANRRVARGAAMALERGAQRLVGDYQPGDGRLESGRRVRRGANAPELPAGRRKEIDDRLQAISAELDDLVDENPTPEIEKRIGELVRENRALRRERDGGAVPGRGGKPNQVAPGARPQGVRPAVGRPNRGEERNVRRQGTRPVRKPVAERQRDGVMERAARRLVGDYQPDEYKPGDKKRIKNRKNRYADVSDKQLARALKLNGRDRNRPGESRAVEARRRQERLEVLQEMVNRGLPIPDEYKREVKVYKLKPQRKNRRDGLNRRGRAAVALERAAQRVLGGEEERNVPNAPNAPRPARRPNAPEARKPVPKPVRKPDAKPEAGKKIADMSDAELIAIMRKYRDGGKDPFGVDELSDEDLIRLNNLLENNQDEFFPDPIPGVAHPAFHLVGGEVNHREDNNLWKNPKKVSEKLKTVKLSDDEFKKILDNPAALENFINAKRHELLDDDKFEQLRAQAAKYNDAGDVINARQMDALGIDAARRGFKRLGSKKPSARSRARSARVSQASGTPIRRPEPKRLRGDRIDAAKLDADQSRKLKDVALAEKARIDADWRKRLVLGPNQPITARAIKDYIKQRENNKPGAYIGVLKANANDWDVLDEFEKAVKERPSGAALRPDHVDLLNKVGPKRRKGFIERVNAGTAPGRKPSAPAPEAPKPASARAKATPAIPTAIVASENRKIDRQLPPGMNASEMSALQARPEYAFWGKNQRDAIYDYGVMWSKFLKRSDMSKNEKIGSLVGSREGNRQLANTILDNLNRARQGNDVSEQARLLGLWHKHQAQIAVIEEAINIAQNLDDGMTGARKPKPATVKPATPLPSPVAVAEKYVDTPKYGNALDVLVIGEPRPRANHVPMLAKDGSPDNPMPAGKLIVNSQIKTPQDAIKWLNDGKSIGEIPQEFWWDALVGHVSKNNPGKKQYKQIPKNGGVIGDTLIFVAIDGKGKSLGQGFVLKHDRHAENNNVNAVLNFQIANALGIPVDAAAFDGFQRGADVPAAIIPFAWNRAPVGDIITPEEAGIRGNHGVPNFAAKQFDELPDKAHPQRLAGFLLNYMLQVPDRHDQNHMGAMVNGKPMVIPIDLDWGARRPEEPDNLFDYTFWADGRLFKQMKTHLATLTPEERQRQLSNIINTYDAMVARSKAILSGGLTKFQEDAVAQLPAPAKLNPEVVLATKVRARGVYGQLKKSVAQLDKQRDEFINAITGGPRKSGWRVL